MSEYPASQEITCKKIQNYIFNFSDLLGQGNFSKVYKAHHEVTSKAMPTQGRRSRSR
jgi:predicted Ser/Thr protein kinase